MTHSLLALLVTVVIVGCASSRKTVQVDFREERLRTLTDQLEFQGRQLKRLTAEVKELNRQKEKKPAATAPTTPTKRNSPPMGKTATPAAPKLAAKKVDVEDDDGEVIADSSFESMHSYFQGLQELKEKRHEEAASSFRDFLKKNPEHVYADRARYLVAKALFENKEYQLSVVAVNQLLSKHPESFRTGDALFLKALAYDQMGSRNEADSAFRDIIQRYPHSENAKAARRRLAESIRTASAPQLLDRRIQ